jgi:hypothetical protein
MLDLIQCQGSKFSSHLQVSGRPCSGLVILLKIGIKAVINLILTVATNIKASINIVTAEEKNRTTFEM